MKKVSINWNDTRKKARIIKWLKLDCSLSGHFTSPLSRYNGYKSGGLECMTFWFPNIYKEGKMKKYNDSSEDVRDWSLGKLKSEAVVLHEMVRGDGAIGVKDLLRQVAVESELSRRGVEIDTELVFN